jgi:hypothetical protein
MTKTNATSDPKNQANIFINAPAYPKTSSEVIRQLKRSMDMAERPPGHALGQKEFGMLLGAPRSTIHDWFHGKLATPIEHFLCAIERLSEAQRTELFRSLCRDCPRLQHPRLAHDQQAVNALKGVMAQPAGLILVTGPSELRTFVITAIGNSVGQLLPERTVSGIDVHHPEHLVPVVGVHYLRSGRGAMEFKSDIREICQQLCNQPSDVILLNGVWSILPDLRNSIAALAEERTLMVADEFETQHRLQHGPSLLVSIVKTRSGEQANQIQIDVKQAGRERPDELW